MSLRFSSVRTVLLGVVLVATLLLSGCVRYDVGVDVQRQFKGKITQHITLGDQITSLSPVEAKNWLKTFEDRAKTLQGKTEHLSESEVLVTIPFGNGAEMVEKFNQFFNTAQPSNTAINDPGLANLSSKMTLKQRNFLLADRDRLNLSIDLRGLGVLANQETLILSPESLVNIEFRLTTPWGSRSIIANMPRGVYPPAQKVGNQLIWQLKPGEINHIEAVYWVPSYLAWGTIAIALLVILGSYFKYKQLPWQTVPTIGQ
ncbi:MAG: DUF3153 domain-containing protein [Jaaginema sp. PMC 1079.18]|nr:DUF3153 domain-containing protein [Jaaginema sp. PMC 1080.18]MEC4849620.1 DUF3153 domain-containing protein [Jaaginema sp. PMC 1079.18]MEC4866206.1 DUF3153 domain-containing protein [Jaaginema sp. PMC 1078.18]